MFVFLLYKCGNVVYHREAVFGENQTKMQEEYGK